MQGSTREIWAVLRAALMAAPLAAALSAVVPGSAQGAASTLYDMTRLLNEPHPFDQSRQAPRPGLPPDRSAAQDRGPASSGPSAHDGGYDPVAVFDENDPLEPMNRFFFGFNEIFNDYLLGPIAKGYNAVLPEAVRGAIGNMFDNIKLPVVIANDILQGEFERAASATGRLGVNSTVGVLGMFDVAKKLGMEAHDEDFGQTLAVWGVGEGLYLILPVFGPSNPRDAVGKLLVDGYFDPLGLYLSNTDQDEIAWTLTGIDGVITYAEVVDELERLKETSVDFYGAIRSLYRQKRASEIANGTPDTLPNFDLELDTRP